MKYLQIISIVLFFCIVLVPVVTFNTQEEAISTIDNRMLAANPFDAEVRAEEDADFTQDVEAYISDRIGLRDKMISAYTILNDKLFNKMVHPSYTYGKDGYVFGEGLTQVTYGDFHEIFVDMVAEINDYCEARGVPFLFVFNPAKPAVLTEYLPDGIQYDRSWVNTLLAALEEKGVPYLDNTTVLRQKTEEGEMVFNQKYDANHWNDRGAYYGTNAILAAIQDRLAGVRLNDLSEFTVSEQVETTLQVSEFPIYEAVPSIWPKVEADNVTESYQAELEMHPSYQTFGYYRNEARLAEGAPKALVFQGSYMNIRGSRYLQNALGEYIHVHDYQNIIDFDYYYQIFRPDCVIFEVAEYTFIDLYFDSDEMAAMQLNPTLESAMENAQSVEQAVLDEQMISVEQGESLTKIQWNCGRAMDYVWMTMGEELDMRKVSDGVYEVTVENSLYDQYHDRLSISAEQDGVIYTFKKG